MADDDLNINITGKADGLDAASKKAKTSLDGVAGSAKQIETAFKTLSKAIDPTFTALDRYNKAQAANATLMKAGVIDATAWANAQVKLRQEYDATVAAIHKKSAAGKAEAEAEKRNAAEVLAAQKAKTAEEKRLAAEAAAAVKTAAKEKAAAEKAELKAIRDEARAAAAEAKRLSRERLAQERADRKAEADATRAANKEKRDSARSAAEAAKQSAREAKAAARDEARAAREAADAIEEKARAQKQAAQATIDLRSSVDPAFAAQTRYNQTMATATSLLMQNKLKQGEWIAIQRQAKAQMDLNTRSMGRMNSVYVQLGYQAQDVTAQLASGTNPLVILAQQGGQTAAAMSMMGGKIGSVAAFLAGPWGAAIIGATLLLGYFLKSSKDTEKATLDLMDAESRRAQKLPELTKALEEYAKAQREANLSEEESLRLRRQLVEQGTASTEKQLATAREKLRGLEARAAQIMSVKPPGAALQGVQLLAFGALSVMIKRARGEVELLERSMKALGSIDATAGIDESQARAAAATDQLTAAKQEHDRIETRINNAYTARLAQINKITDGAEKQRQLAELNRIIDQKRIDLATSYKKVQDQINEAKKKEPKATTEETRNFMMPVEGRITSRLGPRSSPGGIGSTNHPGLDIATGGLIKAVRAAEDGVVRFAAATTGGYGNLIKIAHGAGTETRYGHLSSLQVESGQRVQKGDIIGMSGGGVGDPGRGNSTGRHLHYEVRVNGKPVDPTKGIFPVDQLDQEEAAIRAETAALREAQQAATDAHNDAVGEMEFRQTLAGEDLVQVLAIQDEKIAAIKAHYGESSREAMRASRERILIERRAEQQILADKKASLAEQLKAAQATQVAIKDLQDLDREMRSDDVSTAEGAGILSPEAARIEKARILDEEYADQAAHEAAMYQLKLAHLRASLMLPNISKEEARRINTEILDAEAAHLSSMRELNNKYQADVNRVRNEAFAAQAAKWRDMASTISGSMRQAFQGIWTHQTTFFQTMVNMADAIVYKFADMGTKLLEDWMVKQAVKMGLIPAQQAAETAAVVAGETARTGVTVAGETTRQGVEIAGTAVHGVQELAKTGASVAAQGVQTGAKVAGEGTRGTVGAAGALAEILRRAATSAAGAFSSTVVIPFIGPVAAPVAAAAALAAVLGFGALVSARGGQERVPTDGQITELHKDEMVLPAWMANPFRESLRNPMANSSAMIGGIQSAAAGSRNANTTNSSSNSNTFNYQPQHTNMGAGFDELLKADGRTLRRWFRNELRNGVMER